MKCKLVLNIEHALGWDSAAPLGETPVLGQVQDLDFVRKLFNSSKLFELIKRRSLEPPQLRFFRDGDELHPNEYLSNRTSRRQQVLHFADLSKISPLLDSGATLVLDGLDTLDPLLEVASRSLQWWTKELVQVNAYFTSAETRGFPLHWDDHDVLILQLEGQKYWEVRGRTRTNPMFRDAAPNVQPSDEFVWTGVVKSGDVLHIPRGYWHQAHREHLGPGHSLHLTFGIVKRTGVDWFSWLADQARSEEVFRRDLTTNEAPKERAEHIDLMKKTALRLVESFSPDNYLVSRRRTQPPTPALRYAYKPITQSDPIVCVCEFPPDVEKHEDTYRIFGGGSVVTILPSALAPAKLLLSGSPVTLEEVESLTGVDASSLVDVLLENGLCAVLNPELSSAYTDLTMIQPSLEKLSSLASSG